MSEDTNKNFYFTVEGEPLSIRSSEGKVKAEEILALAQEKKIKGSEGPIENLTLKGKDAVYAIGDEVDLLKEEEFSLGVKAQKPTYHFKVNGQELDSNSEKLVALDIIKIAGEKGVPLPGQIEDLRLEVVGGPTFENSDWVDLEQFNEFLLMVNTPTPVAFMQ